MDVSKIVSKWKNILSFAIISLFHGNLGPLMPHVNTFMLLFFPFDFLNVIFGMGPYNDTWMVSSKLAKAQKLTTYYVSACSSQPNIIDSLFFQHIPFCMWHWQIKFTTLYNMLCTLVLDDNAHLKPMKMKLKCNQMDRANMVLCRLCTNNMITMIIKIFISCFCNNCWILDFSIIHYFNSLP